jgi:hypothetical protein
VVGVELFVLVVAPTKDELISRRGGGRGSSTGRYSELSGGSIKREEFFSYNGVSYVASLEL